MRRVTGFMLLAVLFANSAWGAVFQYTVPVETKKGEKPAFLWIPPEAKQVRGILISGMTLAEQHMSRDPMIRKACADQQLAIIFMTSGLGSADIQALLDTFAKQSGYQEIAVAPLFFMGHSAGGPQAKSLAVTMADRCFGLMQYRGGAPLGEQPVPPHIPALMMVGQFDEFGGQMRDEKGREAWEGAVGAMSKYRAINEANLGSVVIEPGAGHFAWSKRNAEYFGLFLAKAAAARIPERWPVDARKPPALNKVDPKSGWLSDMTHIAQKDKTQLAPYADYKGDRSTASWHFDKALAEATLNYHHPDKGAAFGKKDQFIKWNDPHWVDAGARFFFTNVKWVGDGSEFEVHPVYAEKVPGQYKGHGPRWHSAGQQVGHADAPIHVRVVGGPIVVSGEHRFRLSHDNLTPVGERSRATFMAFSMGDKTYRYTEHVGMLPRGFKGHTKGKAQKITFARPGNLKVGGEPIKLQATSDSGLAVRFYVAFGPAVVKDGRLHIADLPARATYPVPVRIVAYQPGSGIKPGVKAADAVEYDLVIEK